MNIKTPNHMIRFFLFVVVATTVLISCSKQDSENPQEKKNTGTTKLIPKTTEIVQGSREQLLDLPATFPAGAGENESPSASDASSNPNLRPPLTGTGRVLPDEPIPEVAKKVRATLKSEFGGLRKGDPLMPLIFKKLWKRTWPDSFNNPLVSSQDSRVAGGETLPPELTDFRKESEIFIGHLQKGSAGIVSDDSELEAAYLMLALSIGEAESGAVNLIRELIGRANQLPPSKGDVILFNIVTQALRDMKQGGTAAVSFDDLRPLATGKNPVYRLIALQASYAAVTEKTRFSSTENSQTELENAAVKTSFYRPYLDESDPQIVKEALRALGAVPSQEAISTLKDFRKTRAGQDELAAVVDDAIHSCEAMLLTFQRK